MLNELAFLVTQNGRFAIILLVTLCFCDKTATGKSDLEKNLLWYILIKEGVPNDGVGVAAGDQSKKLRSYLQLYTGNRDSNLEVGNDTYSQRPTLVRYFLQQSCHLKLSPISLPNSTKDRGTNVPIHEPVQGEGHSRSNHHNHSAIPFLNNNHGIVSTRQILSLTQSL